MVNIRWYYARTGPGQVAEIASYTTPVNAKLSAEAHRIGASAKAILNSEPKIRTGDSQVTVEKHDLDYYVLLDDSAGEGKGGAAGIEMRFGVLGRSI
ncbi:hypothetical protein ACU4IU_00150 [Brevibacterium sp. CSND-B09]|uniref:hypothetical protein n=1 Tax=Brevibacterium sp. CSND-B09 TaxID=3462571 RepID=UPI00406A8F93